MKKSYLSAIIFTIITIFSADSFAWDNTHSGRAVKEAGKAGSHSSASAGHSIAGSAQVTSAASAVPFAIAGSAGAVSMEIAGGLMDAATAPIGAPLEITDESVTAGPPPNQALVPKANRHQVDVFFHSPKTSP